MTSGPSSLHRVVIAAVRVALFAVLSTSLIGCSLAAAFEAAKHMGIIRVSVTDQTGLPVPGVLVTNEWFDETTGQWRRGTNPAAKPAYTGKDGRAPVLLVNVGRRRVILTLPAGYEAGADGLIRDVVVVAEKDVPAASVVQRVR